MEYGYIATMNRLLTDMFLECIDNMYKDPILRNMIGQPNKTFVEIFEYYIQKYEKVTLLNVEDNRTKMNMPWDATFPPGHPHKTDKLCG